MHWCMYCESEDGVPTTLKKLDRNRAWKLNSLWRGEGSGSVALQAMALIYEELCSSSSCADLQLHEGIPSLMRSEIDAFSLHNCCLYLKAFLLHQPSRREPGCRMSINPWRSEETNAYMCMSLKEINTC